ncbi:hypothetical protein FSP39_002832 [Pinctada imbricata]|uniref:Uncharacterized protein n=1 Tax=Pinctada imbricata TaxID=66713 RepID=A0AA88Y6G0_PINIB|nr:hypothetical protein FSP39_002832 [Pinctada imbricata]
MDIKIESARNTVRALSAVASSCVLSPEESDQHSERTGGRGSVFYKEIPRDISDRGNYTVEVRGRGISGVSFRNSSKVDVINKSTAIFIQTDKATYRPGSRVLPKFEVIVTLPSFLLTTDGFFTGSISAKYTFGKPVSGTANLSIRRSFGNYINKTFPITGTVNFRLPMSEVITNQFFNYITVKASVIEGITGNSYGNEASITIYQTAEKLEFLRSGSTYFKPLLPYVTYLFVTQKDGKPLVGQTGHVNVTISYNIPERRREPETSSLALSIRLPRPPITPINNVVHSSTLYKIPSNGIIRIAFNERRPKIPRRATNVNIRVISKGKILQLGSRNARWWRRRRFSLELTVAAAPRATVIVYTVRRGEIVADSVSFSVEGVFQNRVAIKYRKEKSKPGTSNALILRSDPDSLVNVLAVDKSVLLLRTGNDITRNDDANLIVMTDAILYRHVFPIRRFTPFVSATFAVPAVPTAQVEARAGTSLAEPERTRSFFPETLLFDQRVLRSRGRGVISFTVPDQITTYVTTAFAINLNSGLGIVENPANLTVFQNFFIRVNPTPSAIRGEIVIKQIDIFNYGEFDEDVQVELKKGQFDFADMSGNPFNPSPSGDSWFKNVSVKQDSVASVFFPIISNVIGKIKINVIARSIRVADAIIKEMDVKPEGIQRRYYIPILKDLTSINAFSTRVSISFPPNLVVDSEYIKISAIGDLMGSTVAGLEDLLRMSYGCGEQNMINFAPNVFVTKYLNATNRLTPEQEERAKGYLLDGYQRQLGFQRFDGSFSAFGDNDRSGSTWLTSFVLKSFAQAKDAIIIDTKVMKDAVKWILRQQNENGSFNESGIVIHKAMQGGSIANERSLTAFVVIALQEAKDQGFIPQAPQGSATLAINKATAFLASAVPGDIQTLYELAIITYALKVTNHSKAGQALAILETKAITEDGVKYWSIPSDQASSILPYKSWQPPKRQVRALDIEVTSYALLTYVRNADTDNGILVLKWLASQRNDRGGFVSTQDTVLAIQAFAEFSALVFSENFNIRSNVRSLGTDGFQQSFTINNQNALVLQEVEAPRTVRELNITARGQGICLTEISVFFNVEEDLIVPAFFLNVSLSKESINGFKIHICFSWLRGNGITMALLEIGIPTGMEGDIESLDKSNLPEIKKVEAAYRKIDVYLDSVSSEVKCLSMDVNRVDWIARHKSVPVVLTDYYEPTNQVTKFYISKVLSNSTIIEVCQANGCMDVRVK